MELQAILNNVIVEQSDTEDISNSGIVLSSSKLKTPNEGIVLAMGPDVLDLAVGDKIVFTEGSGKATRSNGKEYLIVKDTDILAVLV